MSISVRDVVACGGVLCEGELLIPADVEFRLSSSDDPKDTRRIPKVLKRDTPSVRANVCKMVGIELEDLDAECISLDWQDGAPLELYGFCMPYRRRDKDSRYTYTYTVKAVSNYGYGKRFVLCKELMQVVCFHREQNFGPNLLDALDSEEEFGKVLKDIVKLVKAPWVENVKNPANIDDETAAFYMALEVLIPRRLDKRLKQCIHPRSASRQIKEVAYEFAVPPEVVEHFFKKQKLDDAQGAVKCSYYDYREQETRSPDLKNRESKYRQLMRSGRI